MPYIQFKDQQFPLAQADLTVGAFDGAGVRLPGDDPSARAILKLAADGTGLVRRGAADAVVLLNGVQLGAEPSPILHGDKVEVAGCELRYGDDKKSGSTQFLSAASIPDSLKARVATPKKPTTATGGRLVSLVDGREYPVPDAGVTFGREIGCDIVIASTEVSRKHATIAPGEGGYLVADLSTNGVFVNGVRIEKTQMLGRGDVLKIGPEEFRFYADMAKSPTPVVSAPPVAAASLAPTGMMMAVPRPTPPAVAPAASSAAVTPLPVAPPVMAAPPAVAAPPATTPAPPASRPSAAPPVAPVAPVAPRPSAAPPKPAVPPGAGRASIAAPASAAKSEPLAVLEVINEGPWKGVKFEIFTPLTNVGRGGHNDISINDESVSDSHAKVLKRDGGWWLVDQGSTNGSYIGGRRVQGEQQIVGAPDVRFGGVKMIFRPAASAVDDDGKGTRAIAAFHVDAARKTVPHAAATPAPRAAEPEPVVPAEKKKWWGCAAMIAFLVTLAAVGASTLVVLLTSRG